MRPWLGSFVCLVACSGSSTPGEATDSGAPAATCGTNVGDTLCDLDLQGYQRDAVSGLASTVPASTFKTSGALGIGTQRYAFIFNTAYW